MNNTIKCSFITLGCKVNQYETDFMAQCLRNEGYVVDPLSPETDFVIINTCTVTNEADRKSRQMIRKAVRIATNATTIAMGCSIQVMNPRDMNIADYHFGNGEKKDIVRIINQIRTNQPISKIDKAYWLRHSELSYSLNDAGSKTRQNLMIQEGCSNACTYCKIFHARGTKSISKNPDLIISELKTIAGKGCKEFVLTGINLGAYEWKGLNLSGLLNRIEAEVDEPLRLRLSSLNPEDVTDELCDALKSQRYCPHLHLSIQSGSDKILKKMNRKYDSKIVVQAVEKLRETDPLFSISCDIIVGFPGEKQEDFQDTLNIINLIQPLKTHVFRYSMKKGTPAASIKNQVDELTKKRRARKLNAVSRNISVEVRNKHVGIIREVIAENTTNNGLTGHDEYYLKHVTTTDDITFHDGDKIKMKIQRVLPNSESDEVSSTIESIH